MSGAQGGGQVYRHPSTSQLIGEPKQSKTMSNFEPNAIIRGAQLTMVGAFRALQNPGLFKHEHYKQAAIAVAAGVIIQLILSIPVFFVRASIYTTSFFVNLEAASWDDWVIETMYFLQHSVLQVPFFLMTLWKYVNPALDNMFMESLEWVDTTYIQKHKSDDPKNLRALYYPNLKRYEAPKRSPSSRTKAYAEGAKAFAIRYGRRAGISLAVYALSSVPYVGKVVLPALSFYTFNRAVGPKPAIAIFACGAVVPKKYFIIFLQTYFSSRTMMRELLQPYFGRLPFDKQQKRAWLKDREGVLFGFGVGFFMLVKIPYVGVLVYGIAEASTAFLITKITDPPPPPEEGQEFVQSQIQWKNKKEFLRLPLEHLDALNAQLGPSPSANPNRRASELPDKKYS